jgi:hypothetical protein
MWVIITVISTAVEGFFREIVVTAWDSNVRVQIAVLTAVGLYPSTQQGFLYLA